MTEITSDRIKAMLAQGESDTIEFKTAIRNSSTLAQNLSAFANVAGGTILIGIQEPDIIVGADQHQVVQLLERSKKQLSVPIEVRVETITIDQKPIVALTVQPSKEIVFSNGQALARTGAMIQAMTPAQVSSKLSAAHGPVELNKIAQAIAKQTETIQKLLDDLREANTWKNKLKEWLIGGAIGAVLGFLLSLLLQK